MIAKRTTQNLKPGPNHAAPTLNLALATAHALVLAPRFMKITTTTNGTIGINGTKINLYLEY